MVGGATEVAGLEQAESNRSSIISFVEDVLIQGNIEITCFLPKLSMFCGTEPSLGDNFVSLKHVLSGVDKAKAGSAYYKI